MRLKVLLPFRVLLDEPDVSRIIAETQSGSFGLLPHRRDCVAALVPGILTYQSAAHGEVFVAVDAGVLVKTGANVTVSVRRAVAGPDLAQLREAVRGEFLALDDQERGAREAASKLESGFVSRYASLQND